MKQTILKYKNIILSTVLILMMSGCGEMLDNPLKDKETGEDINLLIVDFNFFTVRTTYKFVDVSSNETITKEARVWFTGANADDVITFAGEKEAQHVTSQGQLELTIDPNVEPSTGSPINFTVHVEVEGYQEFAQTIQINTDGKKTYELYLSPVSGGDEEVISGGEDPNDDDSFVFSVFGVKSTKAEKPYKVNYKILKEDLIKFKDYYGNTMFNSVEEMMVAYQNNPDDFLLLTFDIKTGFPGTSEDVLVNGEVKTVQFQKLETGDFIRLNVNNRTVYNLNGGKISQTCEYTGTPAPDLFGLAKLENDSWQLTTGPKDYNNLDFSYTVAKASLEELCGAGGTIKFMSNANSSFSIDGDIYDSDNNYIKTVNFKGSFPESFVLENVPNTAAVIKFRSNNPAFKPISDLEVANLCSGTYEVNVDAQEGYTEYLIALKARCSDEPTVALAPTYSGEIKIKDSSDPWQGIDMKGGIVNVLAKENTEYQIRFLWKDAWETSTFTTEFDANGNYVNNNTGADITSEKTEDGRIKIFIEHTFEQDVCDDLSW